MATYYKATFDLNPASANYGKLVIEDVTAIPTNTETTTITVTDPNGDPMSFAELDLTASPQVTQVTASLPTLASGKFVTGDYSITLERYVNGSLFATYEVTACLSSIQSYAAVNLVANCLSAKMKVSDETSYPSGASVSRTITVTPPTVDSNNVPTPITTSLAEKVIDFTWGNVDYHVLLEADVTYTIEGTTDVEYVESISIQKNFPVRCPVAICELQTCISQELTRLTAKASGRSGYKGLDSYDFDKVLSIISKLSQYNALISCGSYFEAEAVYTDLAALVGCSSCNTAAGDTRPVRVANDDDTVPPLTITETYPVTVDNTEEGVFIVGLDATWLANVNDSTIYDIEAGDTSLDVSSATVSQTKTYTIAIDPDWFNTNWTSFTRAFLEAGFDEWSENVVAYRAWRDGSYEVVGKIKSQTALTQNVAAEIVDLSLTGITADSHLVGAYKEDGTYVGAVYMDTGGSVYLIPVVDLSTDTDQYISFRLVHNENMPVAPSGGSWV